MSSPAPSGAIHIIGGGLAGCEAALQLADRNHDVILHEMRPGKQTPAHRSGDLAEVVCSNSFKSELPDTASGSLKAEMRLLGCRLLEIAGHARVPAGAALAVDTGVFAERVQQTVTDHPRIRIQREEITGLIAAEPGIVATGPLTSASFKDALVDFLGEEGLYFHDAIAPSIHLESIDPEIAFRAARYEKGDRDYLNCPFDRDEYEALIDAILGAEMVELKEFEKAKYFQGCMPIEVIVRGGRESLRFGPLRPVGLIDPRTGRRPWAVLQLRQESLDGSLYGMVGFQTQMKHGEQKRVFRLIPGLQKAEFARLGSLHRNFFLNSSRHLNEDLSARRREDLFFAGQMIGCEGYVESMATGLMAALFLSAKLRSIPLSLPPVESVLGALLAYLREEKEVDPSPMNANFGLLPALENPPRGKKERKQAYSERALRRMSRWRSDHAGLFPSEPAGI